MWNGTVTVEVALQTLVHAEHSTVYGEKCSSAASQSYYTVCMTIAFKLTDVP